MRSPKIEFWEVIHTRVSCFQSAVSLDEMATRLVTSGACVLAFDADGSYWHLSNGNVVCDHLSIKSRPQAKHGTVSFNPLPDELCRNCLLFAAELAFIERQTLTIETQEVTPYIRCFFEPILVEENGRHFSLYPYVKIFHNSVSVLSLRVFSGETSRNLEQVAEEYLGLSSRYFDNILLPISVFQNAPTEDFVRSFLELNPEVLTSEHAEELGIALMGEDCSVRESGQDRMYRRTALEQVEGFAMLTFIWDILEGLLDDLAYRPPMLRVRSMSLRRAHYERPWFGHPILFLIKWPRQPESASKLGALEGDIARLIAGSPGVSASAYNALLQPLPRIFDDYRIYMTEGLSVYAMSAQCWKRAEPGDTHLQRVPLPMIVNEELALWLTGSFRALERRAQHARTHRQRGEIRRELLLLEQVKNRLSHFGELEDLFKEYLARFGIERVISRTQSSLQQLDHELKDRQNFRIASFGVVVSLLFGVVGSGQVAESVLKPLRDGGVAVPVLFGIPQAASDFLLSAIGILLGCCIAWTILLTVTRKS